MKERLEGGEGERVKEKGIEVMRISQGDEKGV